MKIAVYLIFLTFLISCGTTESGTVKNRETTKSKTETVEKAEPEIDWSSTRSSVEIRKETKVFGLEDAQEIINPVLKEETPKPKQDNSLTREKKGYRIQIFTTNSKKLADEVVLEAKNVYRYKVYMSFSAPNYTIKIGNYSKIEDAKLDLDAVQEHYKNSTVVPDFIK